MLMANHDDVGAREIDKVEVARDTPSAPFVAIPTVRSARDGCSVQYAMAVYANVAFNCYRLTNTVNNSVWQGLADCKRNRLANPNFATPFPSAMVGAWRPPNIFGQIVR